MIIYYIAEENIFVVIVYSKKMGNMKNRTDVKLGRNKKDYLEWTSKPSYIYIWQKIFDNDLVAIHKSKIKLTFNKTAYVKMCIFDLSKVLIYEFHFDYSKNKNGNKSRLFFTDTDSVRYEIKTEEVYE